MALGNNNLRFTGSFSETKLVERLALEAIKIVRLEADISTVISDHPAVPIV